MATRTSRRTAQKRIPKAKAANAPQSAKPRLPAAAGAPAPVARPAAASAPKSPTSGPALRVKRPLPAKSVQKAAGAFKNFSLSRFAKAATPPNYVPTAQAKAPAAVAAVQRKSMTAQTATLTANPPQTMGVSVALTPESLSEFLPSLDSNANTVDLTELLGALQQNLRGRELYASGNPTLNLVVQDSALLSQVQGYINAIKAGPAANAAGAGTPAVAAKAAAAVNPGARAKARAVVKPGAAAKAAAAKKAAVAIKKGGA